MSRHSRRRDWTGNDGLLVILLIAAGLAVILFLVAVTG